MSLGLKQFARIASVLVIGISVALVVGLVLVGLASARATQRVSDAASAAGATGILEARFRSQERLGALHRLSGNEAYALQRRDELTYLQRSLEGERLEADSEYERRVLLDAETALKRHLVYQEQLVRAGRSPSEVVQATQPSFSEVLTTLNKLRAIHRERIEGTRRNAEMLRSAALGAGLAGLVLLGLTIGACLIALRRWVFQPLGEVARALERIGKGDRKTKISEPLPLELNELAVSVNSLAGALEGKHDNEVRYLGMLAHDLRNPLAGLRLGVERLRKCDLPDADRARAAELVGRQIDRFERMVRELLDAAQVESGHMDVKKQPADLRALAADVVELHQATCPNALRLCAPASPVVASVDTMRIEQVLGNLVLNAIHHSPNGEPIDVVVEPGPDEVCLRVTDRGTGIPPGVVDTIFMPFFERSAGNGSAGTGLGLSIVRQIVEAHAGHIEVETALGRGSTFRVHLPRGRPAVHQPGAPMPA